MVMTIYTIITFSMN